MKRRSLARTFHTTQWASFQSLFKVAKVSALPTFHGNEFQTVGAATEKARLAKTVRVWGTASLGAWLHRKS